MRQHPIPQNVLDVEFKLFTRFTLKEFAYLAIGVSFGGIFLYLTTKGQFPSILGVPIFIISSGIGVFFALVPINDQPADKFISNFFYAINRPTQRTWLNKTLKDQRTKPVVMQEESKTKVIGASKVPTKKVEIFEEAAGDDILAEKQGGTIPPKDTQLSSTGLTDSKVLDNTDNTLIITDENISKYQFPIKSVDKLPGNINIWLCTKDNQPMPNVQTYLKDSDGKILYANKTGSNGYFLTNKVYPEGIYDIEFEGLSSSLPGLRIVITKDTSKLPLRITLK